MMEKRYIDVSCFDEIVSMVDEDGDAYVPISAIRRAIRQSDTLIVKIDNVKENENEGLSE